MNNLLIDIGNSHVKTGLSKSGNENKDIKLIGRFSYIKETFNEDFGNKFNDLKINSKVDKIGISVLKGKDTAFIKYFFNKTFKINPVFIDRKLNLPLKINYSSDLGNDRICSASAAVNLCKNKNVLVIDFGTATTYTLILNKVLTGGLISPGIMTSLLSLTEKTSLPVVKLKFPKDLFNDNTSDNIRSGVLYQSLYATESIIKEAKKLHKNLSVIATGGFSNLISSETNLINSVDQLLVLKGINFIISK